MPGRFQNTVSKSSLQSRSCFPYEIEIYGMAPASPVTDLCDKKYYAAKTGQQQWWILRITGMSCQRHRLSLVAKSRQCLQLFSRFSPASSCVDPIRCGVEQYICPAAGSVNVHSRLTVVANAFTERFLSHPSIVTFASHIRSSCRLFRLWYLTCCE